jgi:large-conductance mechanosensitive channel
MLMVFPFLLEEGVLTVGTISGLFTAAMLVSLKTNIIEPCIEYISPQHTLDKSKFSIDFNSKPLPSDHGKIKWQTFLRDFLSWLFVMTLLYIFWRFVLKKYKKQ